MRNAEYFIAGDGCGGGGGGGGNGGGSSSDATPEEIRNALNNISPCSIKKPWLSNLFGTVKTCYDKYDRNHRVKTKCFSNNYLLAYEIGFKTKHQKKGWTGLWRKQRTDKIAAGVNSVTWSFTPEIASFPQYSFPTNYWIASTGELFATRQGYYNAEYIGKGNIPLPELPFVRNADVIVELLVNDFGKFKTEREVRAFFYQNLFNQAKSLLKKQRFKRGCSNYEYPNTSMGTILQPYVSMQQL